MKTDRIIRQSMMFLMFTIVLVIVVPALAYNNATIEIAERYYQKGFAAYNMKQWSDAAWNFKESFQVIPHSMTAYMLSATYLYMESPQQALTYARKAINNEPGLKEPYVTSVREIADWANKSKDDPYYIIKGKADGDRPLHPKHFPPQPDIPKSPKLGTASSLYGNVITPFHPATLLPVRDFTGKWRCNDGGMYFIRQIDSELWWYGQSQDAGRSWSNVFHGRIQGNKINGKWADTPKGQTRSFGNISLQIIENNKLRAINKSGGFGGSEWIR